MGKIWVIGVGSVGTAALYFLSLATRAFSTALIDMDVVKRHNLDRSPIFADRDVGRPKVGVTRDYLLGLGLADVQVDDHPLHASALWNERVPGQPDILISAANEMRVRYYIEAAYPPIQLYGTTGQNWQAAVIRHMPPSEACSLCLFPDKEPVAPMACATAPELSQTGGAHQVDAALPFLSFVAGLMTAAEVMKLQMPEYPLSAERVILNTRPEPLLVSAPISRRSGCICETRSPSILRTMTQGSRYGRLSTSA